MKKLLIAMMLVSACKSSSSEKPTIPTNQPAGRLALGEASIDMAMKGGPDTAQATITIAADGTMTAIVDGKQQKTAKVTAAGELSDDTGKVIGKIDDSGNVTALFETRDIQNGKVVKTEEKWNDIGTIDAEGTFVGKKDGMKVSFGGDGKAVGFPPELTVSYKGAPAQRLLAMFVVVASMAASRASVETSATTGPAAPAPTK